MEEILEAMSHPPWVDPEQFVCNVRTSHVRNVLGLCPLDVEPHNILQCSGFYSLQATKRDFENSLPKVVVDWILECCRQQSLPEAFNVRRELVHFKKVCLILAQEGAHIERQLKRLCVFHYCDLLHTPSEAPEHQRYVSLSCLLSRLKGMLLAVTDARVFTKWICSIPRHPDGDPGGSWVPGHMQPNALEMPALDLSAPEPLRVLPHSLGVSHALQRAEDWLQSHRGANIDPVPATVSPAPDKLDPMASILAPLANGLPTHIISYVEKVFIARGVSKVLRIVSLVARLQSSLQWVANKTPGILAALRRFQPDPAVLSDRIHYAMHLHTVDGIATVTAEVLRWLDVLQQPMWSPGQGIRPSFRAGDPGPSNHSASFLPQDFLLPQLLAEIRLVVEPLWDSMVAALTCQGDACLPSKHLVGSSTCSSCTVALNKVWIHRGVCFRCEMTARSEGRCPFNKSCHHLWFCPHASRCFVCDQWSCEACGMWRGDGELVTDLVEQLQPAAVFLDFDRTVASTRSGGDPLVGQHAVDPLLLALCCSHPNVHIVTRNPHLDSIQTFLTGHGAPATLPVHVVGRRQGREKSDVVGAHSPSPGAGCLLFVDDDIREHCRPAMLALRPSLHRVLFARGV
eukprot:GGOE01042270.1.p1 GENE.GGOE01042270.1~~GGOE01042270.1.p1  ORF type:complete len:634 (+),score=101.69 GGOE01042270.1:23-1903(+)